MDSFASKQIAQLVNPVLRANLQSTDSNIGWRYFNQLAPNIVNIVFIIAAVVFAFMFIISAIGWIFSGGNKAQLEESRKGVAHAVTGLLILFVIYAIVRIINEVLGLNIGSIGGPTNVVNVNPPSEGFRGLGNLTYQSFVRNGINFVLVFGVIIFFFMFISGGIRWITSAGNKEAIESSRKTLTNAIVGLVIVFMVFILIYLINTLFGTNIGGLGTGT